MSQGYDLSSFGSFGFPNINDLILFDKSRRYPSYSQRSSPSTVVEDLLAKAFAKTPKVSEDPHRQCTFSCAESGCLEVQSPNFKTGLQNRRVIPEGHLQQLVTLRLSTKMREAKMLQSTALV